MTRAPIPGAALALCAALAAAVPAGAEAGPQTQAGSPSAGQAGSPSAGQAGVAALQAQIAAFWTLPEAGAGSPRVVLRVAFAPDGRVAEVTLAEGDATRPAATEAAFQAARRAVLRADAAGLSLPAGVAARGLELVFDPAAGAVR